MNGNAMFARRRLPAAVLAAATVIAVILGCPADAAAQTYPERSVRMLIAFAAGGTIDTLGRVLAQKLTETSGDRTSSWRIGRAPAAISGRRRRRRARPTATSCAVNRAASFCVRRDH
jgi:hypothetical protein